MTSGALDVFDDLFTSYLPGALAKELCALLHRDPKRWRQIDPWRVWSIASPSLHPVTPRTPSLAELAARPNLAPYLGEPAAILRCGHSEPGLGAATLGEVLDGTVWILDGFVSALRGRFGVVFNHDGGALILCHEPPQTFPSPATRKQLSASKT